MRFDDLPGQTAIITGGARGLGYSLATALAGQGVKVGLLDILPLVGDSAATLAAEFGVETAGVVTDVTDAASVEAGFAAVRDTLGTPTILITAAGVTTWGDSVDVTPEEWARVVNINLTGTFFATQSFARPLIGAGATASAVLISSMSARVVNVPQRQTSYNATKAAVDQLGASLAVEWASEGIRVNAIAPGYFLSDMTRQFTEKNPELAADWIARIPLGRMGEPRDLHGLVLLLASDASSYLTGQSLVIDGGYTAI
ncbi:MAG: SDR family oxidoreductase [Burkholderiaceae bacterium]|nr:SDR family oxidoreductase [Microbacteriaceae bacterium]